MLVLVVMFDLLTAIFIVSLLMMVMMMENIVSLLYDGDIYCVVDDGDDEIFLSCVFC